MDRGARRRSLRDWATDLAAAGAVGAFLGVLGPFGNFGNGPLWQRVPYWTAMALAGTLVFGAGVRTVLARGWPPARTWAAIAALTVALSAPVAVMTWFVATWIWPVLASVPQLTPTAWYLEVLAIAAPLVVIFTFVQRARRRGEAASGGPPLAPGLLGARPADVLCLSMEDHYVRVHTATGSRLVLATLAQAIAALDGARGLQTHRSWWVAERAVAGAETHGRNVRLQLSNGVSAPVARSAVAAVRAAGWLT